MTRPPRNTAGGGFLILILALAGTLVGLHYHQVTPGFLIGLGLGSLFAAAIWLVDRRR